MPATAATRLVSRLVSRRTGPVLTGPLLSGALLLWTTPLRAQVAGPSLHPALFTAPPASAVQWPHYVLVPQCIVASWRLSHTEHDAEVRRRRGVPLPPDSLVLAQMAGVRDTTPTAAAMHLRGCRARFSPARADSFDLKDLMTLAPAARDYPLADSALRYRLATLPTTSDRAHGAVALAASYLTADASGDSVGGYPDAVELLRRNERILAEHWPKAVAARLQMLTELRQALVNKRLHLDSFTDTTPVSQAALDSLILQPRLALLDSAPSEPYTPDEQAYIFAPAEQGIGATPWLLPHVRLLEHAPRASAAALDSLLRFYQRIGDTTGLGQPLPQITGPTWLRTETPGGRAMPVPPGLSTGRPTFVVLAGQTVWPSAGGPDLRTLLQIRRLQEAIPALDLVVVVPARGLRYASVRDTAAFGLADSTQELASIRRFYFDELRLRGTLVVEPLPWSRYPAPDHRWRGQATATRQRFAAAHLADTTAGYYMSWYLVDATGRVVLRDRNGFPPPRVLATALRRLAALAPGGATRAVAAPVSP